MDQLTIYKASAGSGKTFRLVLEYLKFLVTKPYDYKHILGVTFTNKATREMKERVLKELYAISRRQNSGMLQQLKDETGICETDLVHKSNIALSLILHDYDHFAIKTIDSFFQGILRSFARETGLYGSYEVDLDQQAILEEATDRLMLSVEKDIELRSWLLQMSEEQLEGGGNWQVKNKIISLGSELFNEDFQDYIIQNNDIKKEREKLTFLRNQVLKSKKIYEDQCVAFGKRGLNIIHDNHLMVSDFPYGKSSFANYFNHLATLDIKKITPGKRVLDAIDNPKKWAKKNLDDETKDRINSCFQNGLNDLLSQAVEHWQMEYERYSTACVILKQLYAFGVLTILAHFIREIGKERNTLLLSESNRLLKGIVGENDAPFIYEKAGNYYNHFMIDEFQDTSVMQWGNFKPLVLNSLSLNYSNLIVGDVKQSIYRWRNSDWQLLANQVKYDFNQFKVVEHTLGRNWRSEKNVVDFNNRFFNLAKDVLQDYYNAELSDATKKMNGTSNFKELITDAYQDLKQIPSKDGTDGWIYLKAIEYEKKDDYNEQAIQHLVNKIEDIQKKGVRAGEIAILVRTAREGKLVAEGILNKRKQNPESDVNYELISEDSLFINGSAPVRFIINMLTFISDPGNEVCKKAALYEYKKHILPVLMDQIGIPGRIHTANQGDLFENNENRNKSVMFSQQLISDYFPFFYSENRAEWVLKMSRMPVVEMISELIGMYSLNHLHGDIANIQSFRDVVLDNARDETMSLTHFLDWWHESGTKMKLQTPASRNAIKILTIHKSKGLEFPYVFIPFTNWKFDNSSGINQNILWSDTHSGFQTEISKLPLAYSSALSSTVFATDYYREKLMMYVDNLNLLYVAFTRAEKGLVIFTGDLSSKKSNKLSDVGLLVNQVVEELFEEEDCFEGIEIGKPLIDEELEDSVDGLEENLSVYVEKKSFYKDTLKVRQNYDEYLDDVNNKSRIASINRGRIIHELLSEIKVMDDIEKAVTRLNVEGKITIKDSKSIKNELIRLFKEAPFNEWYSGKFEVLNEIGILSPGNKLKRPDRIMQKKDKIIVVDYKIGKKESSSYFHQLDRYMKLLKSMKKGVVVEGYLWYLSLDKLVQVHQ